jgi:two-component system sensor histidine kinase KdpD
VDANRSLVGGNADMTYSAPTDDGVVDALLHVMAHDLRNRLAAIKASVAALRIGEPAGPGDAGDMLAIIDDEADRMAELISTLVAVSRILTDHGGPLLGRALIADVARRTLHGLGDRAGQLRVDVPSRMPAVAADPILLERVLANLIDNAITHTPPGTRVTVRAESTSRSVRLWVLDRGPGMPIGDRDRLVRPFEHVDHGSGSLGLGLAIARRLVTAMGGVLEIDDTPGGGTTLAVTLPVSRPPAAPRRSVVRPVGESRVRVLESR